MPHPWPLQRLFHNQTPINNMRLQPLAPGLWSFAYETKLMGIAFPCKCFVLQRAGGLLVVSPGTWEAGLSAELLKLGEVKWVFCPNSFHHVHVLDWVKAFPLAEVFAPAALAKKRPELAFTPVTPGGQPFGPEVQLYPVMGAGTIS